MSFYEDPTPAESTVRPSRHILGTLFGISLQQQALFFRQMATMINAGLGVSKSLRTVAIHLGGHFEKVVQEMVLLIDEGQTINGAMAKYPDYFSEFVVSMVNAGEVGGRLEASLNEVANFLERSHERRQKLLSQLVYPILVLHAAILLPTLDKLVIGGVQPYLQAVLPILIGLYVATFLMLVFNRFLFLSPQARQIVDGMLLQVPVVGPMLHTLALSIYLRALGDLAESGFLLGPALQVSARVCGNASLCHRLMGISDFVTQGERLSTQMTRLRVLPPMCLSMIETGEEAGALGSTLRKAASYMEAEFEEKQKRLATVIPVILLLLVGILVGYQYVTHFMSIIKDIMNI